MTKLKDAELEKTVDTEGDDSDKAVVEFSEEELAELLEEGRRFRESIEDEIRESLSVSPELWQHRVR